MELVEFLLARIAEDEAEVQAILGRLDEDGDVWLVTGMDNCVGDYSPARVLAECEAKRRIVAVSDEAEALDDQVWADRGLSTDPGYNDPRCGERILRALALPYADHPDYRSEWAP